MKVVLKTEVQRDKICQCILGTSLSWQSCKKDIFGASPHHLHQECDSQVPFNLYFKASFFHCSFQFRAAYSLLELRLNWPRDTTTPLILCLIAKHKCKNTYKLWFHFMNQCNKHETYCQLSVYYWEPQSVNPNPAGVILSRQIMGLFLGGPAYK